MQSLRRLFPRIKTSSHDVRYAFAGVRPLAYLQQQKPSDIPRSHSLHDHKDDGAAQMLSVVGGKLTTAAQLAREAAAYIGAMVYR